MQLSRAIALLSHMSLFAVTLLAGAVLGMSVTRHQPLNLTAWICLGALVLLQSLLATCQIRVRSAESLPEPHAQSTLPPQQTFPWDITPEMAA